MAKRRLLFCGEASWLSTGFAKFGREVIKRLHATGKYDIAEMGNYGRQDAPQVATLPWRFYGVLPMNEEENRIYQGNPQCQFGLYKFDAVVADFQPDILVSQLDPWMMQHLVSSRFRGNYKLLLTPTVDSAPQRQEWIDKEFSKADVITTYSRFARRVLESQGVKVADVTSPGVDLNVFKPMDKNALRKEWGLGKGEDRTKTLFVIGTVMHNQKRKLFTDLFESYAMLRKKHANVREIEKSVLLCHTSWPDVGWDIPELLQRSGVQRHVIFTYKCDSCSHVFLHWFIPTNPAGMGQCVFCGNHTAHMPNTHNSVSEEDLAEIYNLMDIYCQPAICEGWGVPVVEAKACGIPVLCSNYSALEDHVENGGALPIPVDRYYTEAETMAVRTFCDREALASLFKRLLTNHDERNKLGKAARDCAERLHNWDIVAAKYDKILNSIPINNREETWNLRPALKQVPPYRIDRNMPNDQYILLLYRVILGREPDPDGFNNWMTGLAKGTSKEDVEKFFLSELEAHNRFEEIRFVKSLAVRGIEIKEPIKLMTNVLNGRIL
jgi:glycosyltransferase involved in cell wall biosynthesis